MTAGDTARLGQTLHQQRDALASAWRAAIGRTSYAGLTSTELHQRLLVLAEAVVDVLSADPFDATAARAIGERVADLGYVLPEALGGTLEVLGQQLLSALTAEQAVALQPRLAALQGQIATGFARRARSAILDEQEAIRSALLTMREHAEEALRDSEARFRAVFEGAAIGIAVTDMTGSILQTNRALQTMLGCAENEMESKRFVEFAHPDDVAIAWDAFQRLATTGADRTETELRFVHKDGHLVWGHVAVSLVRDADGRPQFAIGMGEDVTERKKAEEERIQLSREQAARTAAETAERRMAFLADVSSRLTSSLDYHTTLAHVTHAAVPTLADWCTLNLVDADGELQTETAVHIDPDHERLAVEMRRRFPRRPDESPALAVLRTGVPQLLPEISDEMLRRISSCAEHLELWRTLAPRSVMLVPLVAHGRSLGVLSLIATAHSQRRFGQADLSLALDVARRAAIAVENAQLYAQAQDAIQTAQAAVRLRDEFLSVAAHELKTPVTSLRGFAQLTLRTIDQTGGIDHTRLHRALRVVDQQSEKLTRLVAQLLDISRLQSGRLALDCRDTNVSALALDLVTTMQNHSDHHTLVTDVAPDVHARIDPLRLEQVLTNLVDNAIKYSPDGGQVDVELIECDPDHLQLSVRDRGIGVLPEHRERIFERFYQADVTGHHAAGMGLGLYISRQIVELHGGQISAQAPDDGSGTRIVVVLPRGGARSP